MMSILLFSMSTCYIETFTNSDGLEFVNPVWIYKKYGVNWFGAALLSLFFNMLTLPYALCYWIYKLCTVGRKEI